jgi:cob(I)alamin adenosyltransferase
MKHRVPKKLRALGRGVTVLYRGDGKGKTTSAVGVATRAAGYGWKVLFLQFSKSKRWPSGERQALEKLGVDVRVMGLGFVGILDDRKPLEAHRAAARRALAAAKKLLFSGRYKLVVLDEAVSSLEQRLLKPSDLVTLLKARARHPKAKRVHLMLTGHDRYPAIEKLCDLVTEMKLVKHPYYQGFLAVKGIDF